jgi:ribosome-associated protein
MFLVKHRPAFDMNEPAHTKGLRVNQRIVIPEKDLSVQFIRASGPGGQNVNKVSSSVQLRFNLAECLTLSERIKERLKNQAGQRYTRSGYILIEAHRYRDQIKNRRDAEQRLITLIQQAEPEPKTRKPTRQSYKVKMQRLNNKKARANTKKLRGKPGLRD